jgi:Sap, sulfolipid-1-addressing protein
VGAHPELPMLVTVLVMAFAVSVEPFRIGMTVLMLNRPRPALHLLAFLFGGFAMATTVGLVVLFVFRRRLLQSTDFTLPKVQILIGFLALLVAVVVAVPVPGRLGSRPARLARPAQRLLSAYSLWVAGIAGLGIALPSVDYLATLAVILASRATALTQVAVLLMYIVVAFALVEIPLLAYLLAPKTTAMSMTALHNWIRSRRRLEVAILVAAAGCVFIAVGMAGL